MKDFNFMTFIAGLFIVVIVGVITLLLGRSFEFSGLCMVAAAILYSCSLEEKN